MYNTTNQPGVKFDDEFDDSNNNDNNNQRKNGNIHLTDQAHTFTQ